MNEEKFVPFNKPFVGQSELSYVKSSIESRAHCGNRSFGQECAKMLEATYGIRKAFLTPSCTAALEMAAIVAGIEPGDEVILPSWTFSSTANAFVLQGAKPIFCDVDPKTMNIDTNKIEALITEKTKVISPIDYAGIPCDIDVINAIAKKHNLLVVLDAAQSMHSKYKDEYVGSRPDFVAFSFHETKNITCGEGGMLGVNNSDFIEKATFVQEKGTDRSLVLKGVKNKYSWVEKGSSFLLADILAAFLKAQLESADHITRMRSNAYNSYTELFGEYASKGLLQIMQPPEYAQVNNHAFFVIFDTENRQVEYLKTLKGDYNVNAYIGYVPLHSSPMGQRFGYSPGDLPVTEEVSKRLVRLPLYTELNDGVLEYCINSMAESLRKVY